MTKPYVSLVDDDQEFAKILQVVLGRLGLDLGVFSRPEDFLKSLDAKKPQLCLIDLNIQELGAGFKVIEAFRKAHGPKIPLFVISSTHSAQSVAHAMELGATDYILKPVDKETLAAKISRFIKTDSISDLIEENAYEVPSEDRTSTLDVSLEIESVDELGLKFRGPHLVSKGTAMRISGDFVSELTQGTTTSLLLNVTSTWINEDGVTQGAYGEFDHQNDALMASIRRWLTDRLQ